jgi:hypothetical protein
MIQPAFLFLLLVPGQVAADALAQSADSVAEAKATAFAAEEIEFFEKRVRPILVERCFECHSSDAKKLQGNLLLDRRAAILTGGDLGPAAMPGEPEKSLLVEAIRYCGQSVDMPPAGKLPAAEIAILEEWVKRGLPFPADDAAAGPKRRTIDITAGRQHWAFQPAVEHSPPVSPGEGGTRIDAFVRRKQAAHGLSASAPATCEVLIRRTKFDLVGLPPTREEIDAFVADTSPDAYERLIDRYLASPHYGERWGRAWLDLARYCDIGESWREGEGQPWLYRDWVVGAMNRDLAYDDFVRQQLAADLLPNAVPADNAALGYLGLSPTYWKELKLDHTVIKQVVAEEWEERIEAIGATFLGLTVACARCHDHKFDPITTQDYYALAGVLASTRLEDRPIIAGDLADAARAARGQVKELETKIATLEKMSEKPPEIQQQLDEAKQQIESLQETPHFATPVACGVSESTIVVLPDGEHRTKIEWRAGAATDVAVQIRGNAANAGPVVPRRFLAVLTLDEAHRFEEGSGRRELAEAIVTDAAPLAARVIVNRIWQQHFGRGLVTTPSNFGTQGDRPSHPELLDDLAARFIAHGWSLKWLHREIVLSATYQQASERDATKHAIDPDNVWLSRIKPRRLNVEAWRDAMLSVTLQLDLAIGGAPFELSEANNRRRTVYGLVKRRELDDLLRLYDFPDPIAHAASREPTTTPLQQLFALNSPLIERQSAALVERMSAEMKSTEIDDRIAWLYATAFCRQPTAEELAISREFVEGSRNPQNAGESWRLLAQALLTSNEFFFVD